MSVFLKAIVIDISFKFKKLYNFIQYKNEIIRSDDKYL